MTVDSTGDLDSLVTAFNTAIESSAGLSDAASVKDVLQVVTRGETIAIMSRGFGADATLTLSQFSAL